MRRSRFLRSLACAALLSIVSNCSVLDPDPNYQLTLFVAPHTVACVGVGPQRCLRVKERPDQEWTNFYGTISGFTHEPGYTYKLLVESDDVVDPPMDGSSREYRLLRILSRNGDAPSSP